MFDKQDPVKLATLTTPFGKYRGRLRIDLPEPYLLWFADMGSPGGQLGELMQLALEIKITGLSDLIVPLEVAPDVHLRIPPMTAEDLPELRDREPDAVHTGKGLV